MARACSWPTLCVRASTAKRALPGHFSGKGALSSVWCLGQHQTRKSTHKSTTTVHCGKPVAKCKCGQSAFSGRRTDACNRCMRLTAC